ncbi:MAG: hypothetical protein LRY38_06140 [Aeromonadaceae bacterium]|nr:hypothetical protein [Aeromonadaceae bacterium]
MKSGVKGCCLRLLLLWCLAPACQAVTLFTYRPGETASDVRTAFTTALLELALEKTRPQYGDFQLVSAPAMNTARALAELKKGSQPNFMLKMSYDPKLEASGLLRSKLDVDLDIIGYRACFTRTSLLPSLAQVHNLTQLQQFSHGQGSGWVDSQILAANGFKVVTVGQYESLFRMVATGRFDLFCRGINELQGEWQAHRQLAGLAVEPSLLLYYPLPRFFYANPRDAAGLQRVEEGVRLALADGSLQHLWLSHYGPSVTFAQPAQRRLFRLHNPLLPPDLLPAEQPRFDPLLGDFITPQPPPRLP